MSYGEELRRRRAKAKEEREERRHQKRLEAQRTREARKEELRREREQIRSANKLKRALLKEEAAERKVEAAERAERKAQERAAKVSASAIERAYQRGVKTLGEAMAMAERGNPKGTKGKFQRCVEAVSQRGGAYDPNAVCAAQERKKYGQKELTRRAKAGRRAKARNVARPRGGRYAVVTENGEVLNRYNTRKEANSYQIRVLQASGVKTRVKDTHRDNPADSAAEAYKIFHGREPEEFITIAKQRHYHKHLAAAGDLETLVIVTTDKRHRVTLKDFDGALLAFNEQALPELQRKGKVKLTQLFIEGGDQVVDLEDFGIDPDNIHEVETLGKAVKIDYFTTKEHLGSEGGTAVYGHKFRTTNNNGRHETVKIAKYPDVIYRVQDSQLEFSGGSYEIRAEGIDK